MREVCVRAFAFRYTNNKSVKRRLPVLSLPVVVALAISCFAMPLWAQKACSAVAPGTLCLDQPQSGDTKISGQAARGTVDIKVNDAVYRNVRVRKHKFSVPVPALGADLQVMATESGTGFAGPGLTVWGHGLCEANSTTVCLESPVVGKNEVTGKGGETVTPTDKDAGKPYTFVLNKDTVEPQRITVLISIKAGSTFTIPVRTLTDYDVVELDDPTVTNPVAGPLRAQKSKAPPACSEKSAALPCLNPVKTTDKSVTGFAVKGSTIDIKLDSTDKGSPPVDKTTGKFTMDLSSLSKGQTITATQISPLPKPEVHPATTTVTQAPPPASTAALYTLGLVGVNVAGASNSGVTQQYFVSFDTRLALPFLGRGVCASPDEDYVMDYKCWVWFSPRIASAPTTSDSTLQSFSSPSSLSSGVSGQTLGQIAQTFEFQSGLEYALFHGPRVPTSNTVAFRGAISLILGGGIVTPINSTSSASIFTLNNNLGNQFTENSVLTNNSSQSFANTYPALAAALCSHFGYTSTPACTPSAVAYGNVAFVLPNRSRFFRDYFAGIRLRTYFFSGDCSHKDIIAAGDDSTTSCQVANIHPGTFDIRFGQDETVTAGVRRGVVMTVAASYPLPGTAGTIRIFGSTYTRLHHNENFPAMALVAASSTVPITDPSVVIQPINPSDHDYYRLGIGADLIPIITKWMNSKNTSSSSNTSPTSQ